MTHGKFMVRRVEYHYSNSWLVKEGLKDGQVTNYVDFIWSLL